jgi:hypothetical protein
MGEALKKALFESFGVELESSDKVTLEHNYCEPTIVDVVVTDSNGKRYSFDCFNTTLGIFPY